MLPTLWMAQHETVKIEMLRHSVRLPALAETDANARNVCRNGFEVCDAARRSLEHCRHLQTWRNPPHWVRVDSDVMMYARPSV